MIQIVKKLYRAIANLFPREDHQEYDGSIIPMPNMRWCGQAYKENSFYIESAEAEADRLISEFGCNKDTRVLDIGCGQGRLPIGILRRIGAINYLGIDIDKRSINWCNCFIEQANPSFNFSYINLYNERYNTGGKKIDENFSFEIESNSRDIIYLYSVFSHTDDNDFKTYLKDFNRILTENGKIFFTTFVENDVPDISVNPDDYHGANSKSPLLVVRYDKKYLFSIIDELGYEVVNFKHRTEDNFQSALYLKLKN